MFFKRIGTHPIKLTFDVEVKTLYLPEMRGAKEMDEVHVSFERGSKSASTKGQPLKEDPDADGDFIATFNETIKLGVTLYRDSHDNIQEKNGTLTVKLRKRGAAGRKEGKDAFKTIGGVPLSLHDLSDCHQEPFAETLDWCVVEDAKLEFVVTARESVEGENDDTSTVASFASGVKPKGAKPNGKGAAAKKATTGKRHKPDEEESDSASIQISEDQNQSDQESEKGGRRDNLVGRAKPSKREPVVREPGSDEDEAVGDLPPFAKPAPEKTVTIQPSKSVQYESTTTPQQNQLDSGLVMASKTPAAKGVTSVPAATTSSATPTAPAQINPRVSAKQLIVPTEPVYSKKGLQWQREVAELKIANEELTQRHDAMMVLAEKAEDLCADAQKREEENKKMLNRIAELQKKTREIDSQHVSRVDEVEGLVQELIAMKMSAVELFSELEVVRNSCHIKKQRHSSLSAYVPASSQTNLREGGPITAPAPVPNPNPNLAANRTRSGTGQSSNGFHAGDSRVDTAPSRAEAGVSRASRPSDPPTASHVSASSSRLFSEEPRRRPAAMEGKGVGDPSKPNRGMEPVSRNERQEKERERERERHDRERSESSFQSSAAGRTGSPPVEGDKMVPVRRSRRPGSSLNNVH